MLIGGNDGDLGFFHIGYCPQQDCRVIEVGWGWRGEVLEGEERWRHVWALRLRRKCRGH